jgi:Asp-tRNA(Asn)/Glu-tRNA(Gln) amidotransferase A subunit family amidase
VAGASDGGGSIRIPAACTGLVGLKAGRGLIPSGPHDSDPLNLQATDGVISRTVRDTAAMLDVLAGADAVSAFAPAMPGVPFHQDLDRPPNPLRIGFTTYSAIRGSAHPEATRAVESAARLLTELGHDVEEITPSWDDLNSLATSSRSGSSTRRSRSRASSVTPGRKTRASNRTPA